jgi:hypothetical protein
VARIDRLELWRTTGARSAADWLARRTQTSLGDAHQTVKLGATLDASPAVAAAVDAGELSPASAAALFDAVSEVGDVDGLVDAVKGAGPRDARQASERWIEIHSESPEEREQRAFETRSFRQTGPSRGMITTTIIQPVLEARLLRNVANDIIGDPGEHDTRTTEQRLTDGITELANAYAAGRIGGGRERPHLLLVVDADTGEGVTTAGDHVPAHVVARVAEDAVLQRVMTAGSVVLDMGRQVRTATDAQYKALVVRDGGCRFPGCNIPPEWCDVDHIPAWKDGGRTDIDLLVLMCRSYHHPFRHRSDVEVIGDANNLALRMPDGSILPCPPKGLATRRQPEAAA